MLDAPEAGRKSPTRFEKKVVQVGLLLALGAVLAVVPAKHILDSMADQAHPGPISSEPLDGAPLEGAAQEPSFELPDENTKNGETKVAFTDEFASRFRGRHSLADIQAWTGTIGKITPAGSLVDLRKNYWWMSTSDQMKHAYLLITVQADGQYGGSISTFSGNDITFTSSGAFLCDSCNPPVHVCGTKPSWMTAEDWTCHD